MVGHELDLANIALDSLGRAILSDAVLDQLDASPLMVSAGGDPNYGCTNAPCHDTTNMGCSNTQCENAMNKAYCVDGPL